MLHYRVEPFGQAVGLGGLVYDEYRISFSRDQDDPYYHRGSFRLTRQGEHWLVPFKDIVDRVCSYLEHRGAKHFVRKADLRLLEGKDHASYAHLTVLDYAVRIGPLESEAPRVFIDDGGGGCTGHCELSDLPDIRQALHDVWLIEPGPGFLVKLYLNHAGKALRKDR